ncbi:MAG: hypothetical protein RBR74_08920, partial [Ignavibacteriaceae bacterium]|nr:hypothetical protein [Ignavibacteriaceae bacterium]
MQKYSLSKIGFFFLLLITAFACNYPQDKLKENKMSILFYRTDLTTPIEILPVPIKIDTQHPVSDLPEAKPENYDDGYSLRFLNPQRNSRLKTELSKNIFWKVKWKSALNPSVLPWFILINKDRILLQNENGYVLFDNVGRMISESDFSNGNLSINKEENIFFHNTSEGLIQVRDLKTGEAKSLIYPYFGKG